MDRREAVLRELNLYPLWKLREGSIVVAEHAAASPLREPAAPIAEAPQAPVAVEAVTKVVPVQLEQASEMVNVSEPTTLPSNESTMADWLALKNTVRACHACALRAGCTQTVLGVGNEKADWLFIGEAPGEEEDASGEPFVGPAGKLLDNMLLAIKLKRNHVYIANVIKCRPPEDRSPHVGEIAHCLPYLQRQIALIQPKIIVALGKVASNALLGKDATLASLRGAPHDYQGIPLIVTYHPAYLLRSPSEKAKAWQDLCLAQKTLLEQQHKVTSE